MGVITAQQISKYYDLYRDKDITFTKEIIKGIHLDPRQIYIKCSTGAWPCILNSTSFLTAKIIVGTKSGGAFTALKEAKEQTATVNLKFCFTPPEQNPITFFIGAKVYSIESFMNSAELSLITLQYAQRPPDDLIEIIGTMIEANINAIKRKEERVVLTDEIKRKVGLSRLETVVNVQNIPRNCILRDISFSGSQIILKGLSAFIKDKEAVLKLEFEDPREIINIPGKIVAASNVGEHKDIVAASIKFNENEVPTSYKIHLNNYLTSIRKSMFD